MTQHAYDAADRLTSVTDARSPRHGVTQYAYDTESNLIGITNATGRPTTFDYDSLGRVTATHFPSTLSESYGYDAVGNLTSKTDRKRQTIQYVYDALNRLTEKQYPDQSTVNYSYDNDSRLTQVVDASGTYGFSYDRMGRLTGTTTAYSFLTGRTFTNSYGYDAASNRTGYTDPESSATTYGYDTLNRLTSLSSSISGQFSFNYDGLSRRTLLTRPNGVNTSYSYDSLSRLLTVVHRAADTTLDGAGYAYDNAGNRTSKTNYLNNTTENYGYDNIYQLLQVMQGANTSENYTYDLVGNRLSSLGVAQYTVNSSNQLISASDGASYTYDNNGNTLTKTTAAGTTSYTWDFENRLTQVTLPGAGGTVTFKYDPFGRRIQKSGPSGIRTYVHDRSNVIEELDGAGNVLLRYTHSLGMDEPLAQLRSSLTSYYHADGLGSITSLTTAASAVGATYSYDTFGSLSASTGGITNSFRYTGREFDPEAEIYYYRARYYDANTARFLSEDPLRIREGPNYYTYVNNDPTDLIDPTGLAKCCPSAEATAIQREADNARARLKQLREFGTAVLPTDTVANVGAMTGCFSGGRIVGTNITVPNQYFMHFRHDPQKQPCLYECDFVHESVHARQCQRLGGTQYYNLTEPQAEIPAYMMELGCYLKMQYEGSLGPYAK